MVTLLTGPKAGPEVLKKKRNDPEGDKPTCVAVIWPGERDVGARLRE